MNGHNFLFFVFIQSNFSHFRMVLLKLSLHDHFHDKTEVIKSFVEFGREHGLVGFLDNSLRCFRGGQPSALGS